MIAEHKNQHGARREMRIVMWLMIVAAGVVQASADTGHALTPAEAAPSTANISIPESYHLDRVRIPMRDGVQLDTFILSPQDTSRAYPILLVRTPYDPASKARAPESEFARAGYIFVTQSARGRYGSDGRFVIMRPQITDKRSHSDTDESTDTFDTIDWLIKNVPHNNGKVGLRGISYNGFYAAAGLIDAHPALKAVSPQAPQADWFLGDDAHHNGAFLLASTLNWIYSCDRTVTAERTCATQLEAPTTDGYKFFLSVGPLKNIDAQYLHGDSPEWEVMMRHGAYDELWQRRNLLPHLRNIKPSVLAVSGWYDANNLYGALHVFDSVRRNSPDTASRLVLGPWTHGQWARDGGESIGPLHFGSETATWFIRNVELPFFESYLKGEGHSKLAVANVFDTGLNQWRAFDTWPPKNAVTATLHLGSHGSVSFQPPAIGNGAGPKSADYDEYVSDPANPVPFVPDHGLDMDDDYMTRDQRFATNRSDVLSYLSEVLTSDTTIAGPISPHLTVSTSGTDSDWVVKLIDVHPTVASAAEGTSMSGFQQLVRGDVMRGKFRNSFSSPTAMQPNEPTRIDFTMPDVYHTFKKGHRILVQVQSSWFPLVDRNPQRFEDIYAAEATDFQPATQRIFHSTAHPSQIELQVLPVSTVPTH